MHKWTNSGLEQKQNYTTMVTMQQYKPEGIRPTSPPPLHSGGWEGGEDPIKPKGIPDPKTIKPKNELPIPDTRKETKTLPPADTREPTPNGGPEHRIPQKKPTWD